MAEKADGEKTPSLLTIHCPFDLIHPTQIQGVYTNSEIQNCTVEVMEKCLEEVKDLLKQKDNLLEQKDAELQKARAALAEFDKHGKK